VLCGQWLALDQQDALRVRQLGRSGRAGNAGTDDDHIDGGRRRHQSTA
jgi:hypothetical protein